MKTIALLVAALLFTGCVSAPMTLPTTVPPPKGPNVLGPVVGSASGFLLLGIIPIMHNERFARAYADALNVSGGNALVDVRVEERWYWTPLGNGFITKIAGTAVR